MLRCLTVFSALILAADAKEISATVFDMPLETGAAIRAEALEDMIPVSIFSVRKNMDQKELIAALYDCRMELIKLPSYSPWVSGVTPDRSYFEYIEGQWEEKRLLYFQLSARRLPPTEGRMSGLVKELGKLLGPPTAAYRMKPYERADPRSLLLEWSKGTDVVRLAMKGDGVYFDLNLKYYPGPANPGLARSDVSSKPEPLAFGSIDELMSGFIKDIGILPPGDGARPPLPLPEGEGKMLAACFEGGMTALKTNRDWKEHLLPFRERLYEALGKHYADLKPRERYSRLLRIAEGKEPGLSSGEVQVGAASFLGTHTDPAVIDFLLAGMDVELPAGVEMECAAGIARQCSGETMDRVISMFELPGQGDKAASILTKLDTPEQLKELKTKANKAIRPIRSRLNDIITYLRRHEGME